MNVKLTITNTLDNNFWGFSDLLDDLVPDVTDDEIRAAILELIHEDNWSAVDPDDGAIWTVSIDGDEPDWQARAEAAERRITELEAQLAAQAWRRPIDELPPPLKRVQVIGEGKLSKSSQWIVSVTHWQPLPAHLNPKIGE